MAKGESYSSAGKQVHGFSFQPIAKGDYKLKLLEEGLGVKKSEAKGPDAIPYINTRFEVLDSAAKEGQKNRLVFPMFFLSLEPGKDGIIGPERQGGIVEFLRANGKELQTGVLSQTQEDGSVVKYLDPKPILEMLQEMTDGITDAHIDIEPGRDSKGNKDPKVPGRNRVQKWLGADAVAPDEDDEAPAPPPKGGLKGKKK